MINIKNREFKTKVKTDQLKKDAQCILNLLDYSDFDLGVLLATNKTMQEYNKKYRNKDKPTDILSFPNYPNLKPGERLQPQTTEDKNLGDIIIAPDYVRDDAPNWKQTFEQRMRILLVHGICHLLGYDHIKDEDYKIMKAQEEFLLQKLEENK